MGIQSSVPVEQSAYHPANKIEKAQGIFMSLLAIGYVLMQVFPIPEVEVSVSLMIFGAIVWSIPRMRENTSILSIILLLSAVGLMLFHNASLEEWLQAMRINITIVALFLF